MEIYVNDCKIDYQPEFPITWGNFFQKLLKETNYIRKDHGIVQVIVDDEESLQVMTEHVDKIVPEEINVLRLFTKDSISITREGFEKVSSLIDGIKTEIAAAADLYREGNIKNASSKIVTIMEAIKPMVNFIQSVGMSFNLNFDEVLFDRDTSLRQKIESFLNTLQDLVAAQMKKDYIEIADYLEYHLIDDMTDWSKIVDILLKEIEVGARRP
jgi:CRISPR/Cas system-associated protein endoribonuclease Cas2